jgi:hypothetical protein
MIDSKHDVSASDVVFALASASPDAHADLSEMIKTVQLRLAVLRDQVQDSFDADTIAVFKKRQIVVLQKWLLCLQAELDATKKIESQFPVLKNKG